MKRLNVDFSSEYLEERQILRDVEIDAIFEKGKKWNLASTFQNGGTAIFPHTYLQSSGHYTAACVQGLLDSGADEVLVLGVLHAGKDKLFQARMQERERHDISKLSVWGIQGPGVGQDESWCDEFSLHGFLFLWAHEVKRRAILSPKLIIRFPFLANRHPERLPGIKELESIVKNAPVIATSDLCHHGLAYGTCPEQAHKLGNEAMRYAKTAIEKNLARLKSDNYSELYEVSRNINSDSLDVLPVLRHLLGPLEGEILDMTLVDTSQLYLGNPTPSWVAASLVAFNKL